MTTPQPQHAIDAAITQEDRELARSLVRPFLDMQGYDAIQSAQRACQIIANHRAAHPDPELAKLRARVSELEQQLHALRLVCGTTDANKFETALDRANERINELEARILADNKAYGCELRDPNGTIWEYAETLKKRVAELELQTFDIKKLEVDKARLDWLEEVHAGCNHGPSDKPTMFHCWVEVSGRHENPADHFYGNTLRAAIDAARSAQPAANTGDNHRTGG